MKMKWGIMLLVLLVVGVVGAGASLSLCDYHAPQTSMSDLKLSLSYRYFDDPATAGVDINSGRVTADYRRLFDSADFGYTIAGTAELDLANFELAGGLWQGSGTLRYYLRDDMPIFGFGGAETSFSLGQPKPGVNVSVGIGYGRFSDVTPLAKAFKIQKDLLALGAISKPLADDVLMSVATAIGKKVEYKTIKDLVAAVEQIIEKAAGVTLDARALLTIEDDIRATGDEVSCGWAVQGGLGYELTDPYNDSHDVLVTASADAAFAPQPGAQLVFHAGFHGPFDIMAENTLTVNVSYDYALKEDVDLVFNYQFQRIQPRGGAPAESQSATCSVVFNLGGADVSIQVGLSKTAGAVGWSKDVTISAGMDLL